MIRIASIAMVFLAFLAVTANAEEATAEYEVHEWGFVVINSPPDGNNREAFLEGLPGRVRRPNELVQIERRPGTAGAAQSGNGNGSGTVQLTPPNGQRQQPSPSAGSQNQPNGGNGMPPAVPVRSGRFSDTGDRVWPVCDPFVWFYADRPIKVEVKVDMGENRPLCWWPQGLNQENNLVWKKVGLQATRPHGKRLTGDKAGDSEFWQNLRKSRDVKSSYVSAGSKIEKFLMYEFAGLVKTGLRVKRPGGAWQLENKGFFPIKDLLLIADGKVYKTGAMLPGDKMDREYVSEIGDFDPDSFLATLGDRLIKAGLFEDEAAAMAGIMSGHERFFNSKGVKAVYIMNPRHVDDVCKLELTPKPREIKRVWIALVWDAENLWEPDEEEGRGR